jgi:pimeloyl-ACP methyl ester carboxylesterase
VERVRSEAGVGADLAAWVSGPEGAPVVVLVHGYPDTHRVWDALVPLLEREYRVVRYDVRCAGESRADDSTDRAFALEMLSADLAAIARRFGGGRPAHVVGHDWGGIQAWEPLADVALRPLFASFTEISGPCLDHIGRWLKRSILSTDRWGEKLRQLGASWYVAAFHVPGFPEFLRKAVPKQAK